MLEGPGSAPMGGEAAPPLVEAHPSSHRLGGSRGATAGSSTAGPAAPCTAAAAALSVLRIGAPARSATARHQALVMIGALLHLVLAYHQWRSNQAGRLHAVAVAAATIVLAAANLASACCAWHRWACTLGGYALLHFAMQQHPNVVPLHELQDCGPDCFPAGPVCFPCLARGARAVRGGGPQLRKALPWRCCFACASLPSLTQCGSSSQVQALPPLLLDRAAQSGWLGAVRDSVHVLTGKFLGSVGKYLASGR